MASSFCLATQIKTQKNWVVDEGIFHVFHCFSCVVHVDKRRFGINVTKLISKDLDKLKTQFNKYFPPKGDLWVTYPFILSFWL
jgi:hypothetical protein